MQSTMFLENITVVDHAYINDAGQIIGGSFHTSFKVTGNVDPLEQVVVDFSTIKKDLKAWIDDKEEGFDHKLWLIQGYSNYTLTELEDGSYQIETPACSLIVPKNAVRIFNSAGYRFSLLERVFDTFLSAKLNLQVETELTEIIFDRGLSAKFRYSHGLKNSTSWGCQNLGHGHLSFIQLADANNRVISSYDLGLYADLEDIASDLNNTVFIWNDNIVNETSTSITIKYTTARGLFVATYQKNSNKIVVLDTETTVENLVNYIALHYNNIFDRYGIKYVWVSEGLSKGAIAAV